MTRYTRIVIALAIFLSGLALVPYAALPSQPFRWQQFLDAYRPPGEVSIVDFEFIPNPLVVAVGTTVRWTNDGSLPHTVTSDDALFDSGTLQPGDTFEYLFDTVGTYDYHCVLHPTMTGTVVVVDQLFRQYLPLVLRSSG